MKDEPSNPQAELEKLRTGIALVAQATGLDAQIPGRHPRDRGRPSYNRSIFELARTQKAGWTALVGALATPNAYLVVREFRWAEGATSQIVLGAVRDEETAQTLARRFDTDALGSRNVQQGMRLLGINDMRHRVISMPFLSASETHKLAGGPT